jgi:hypothetical protein
MTGLHDYMMYKKYGYGRACPQLSVDIRNGFITRQRGLQLLKTLEFQFPWQYAGVTHKEVLERLDMTGPEMVSILEKFTNRELTWD